jgi:hypothetical protein
MAVVATQIGFDQVVGDEARLFGPAARRLEDAQRNPVQLVMTDHNHGGSPDNSAEAAMRSGWAG